LSTVPDASPRLGPTHLCGDPRELLDDGKAAKGHVQLAVAALVHSHEPALAVVLGSRLLQEDRSSVAGMVAVS
jgi:hypothetical protein